MIGTLKNWLKQNWVASSILLLFFFVYAAISFVNHYHFRTSALDLGVFNHTMHSYSHGKINHFTLDLMNAGANYGCLSDHFSPIMFLFVPFYFVFGSYTLLLIQIIFILLGALGCYKVAQLKLPNFKRHYLFLLFFLGQWGIISALSFDFHTNVLAACLVPWFFYYYFKKNKGKTILIFTLILISKENMSLWMMFILFGLLFQGGIKSFFSNIKSSLRFEIPLILLAFVYFYLVISVIMPALTNVEGPTQLSRFSHLGDGFGEILKNAFLHPWATLELFFHSTSADPVSFGIKRELHYMILLSGGVALILRPAYLLMLTPIYAQKLLSNDFVLWGINLQYSIEFTPILTLAMIDLIAKFKSALFPQLIVGLSCYLVFYANYTTLENRVSVWYDPVKSDFLSEAHYQSGGLNTKKMHDVLEQIPAEIPLSVSANLAPHLCNRDLIYQFPTVKNAKMIVLLKNYRSPYPLNEKDFAMEIDQLRKSDTFKPWLETKNLLIFERIENK